MNKAEGGRRRLDFAVAAINIAILVGSALFLVCSDAAYRSRGQEESLRDNKFLTIEWRLMKELKQRTDLELRDKDRQIAELRQRYRQLKASGTSAEFLSSIVDQIKKAEVEREALLSVRLKVMSDPHSAEARYGETQSTPSSLAEAPRVADTALSERLRRQIADLEEALRRSEAESQAMEEKLEAFRRDSPQAGAAPAKDPPADGSGAEPIGAPAAIAASPSGPEASDEAEELAQAILAALAKDNEALGDPDAVLSLSDLKTRALLRAIVRTPAIRAQYPNLLESLDRYLSLAGKEEYLRGKREAYESLMETIEALSGRMK